MAGIRSSDPALIDPLDLESTADALCCRFGEPAAEAARLSTLHDVLHASRSLARELDEFTKLASIHYRGVHCTPDMRSDALRLHHALAAWSESILAAAGAYHEWKEGDEAPERDARSASRVRFTALHPTLADAGISPLNAPPA